MDAISPNCEPQESVGRNEVYHYLRNAILEERLKPGQRIIERKVADKLSVSRTPVREAIRKLEQEGLVNYVPNRGAIVASLSATDVWEIYTIRSVLEGLAVRLAAQHLNSADMAEIEELMSQMEQALNEGDYPKLDKIHNAFHRRIIAAARSPKLEEMVLKQADYVAMFTRLGYNAPGRRWEARDEHRQMCRALKKRDVDEAERIARRHIERSCEAYFIQKALMEK
jgi:DNA-binding GntR family transcriptional regulator